MFYNLVQTKVWLFFILLHIKAVFKFDENQERYLHELSEREVADLIFGISTGDLGQMNGSALV